MQTEPLIRVSSCLSTLSATPVPHLRSSVATAHEVTVSRHARGHCGFCPGWVCGQRRWGSRELEEEPLTQRETLGAR